MPKSQKKTYAKDLPVILIDAIEALQLKGARRNTAIQVVSSVLTCQKRAHLDLESFVAIPSSYFMAIDSSCYRALNLLKAVKGTPGQGQAIIEVECNSQGKESFSTDHGIPKSYRVNPVLLTGQWGTIAYTCNAKRRKQRTLSAEMFMWLQADFEQLTIDAQEARQYMNEYVASLDLSQWLVDEGSAEYRYDDMLHEVRFGTRSKKYMYKTRKLLHQLQYEGHNQQIFRAGKTGFVVETAVAFKRRKVDAILAGWSQAIRSLEMKTFEPERISTNGRLLTLLTEFPKLLLPYVVVEDVNLVEVDIANSQVAFLVFLMEKGDILDTGLVIPTLSLTPEARRFIEATKGGNIYQDFAQYCGRDKEWSKRELFRLLFSTNPRCWPSWKSFQQQYGTVATWLLDFNKANQLKAGDENVPLNLAVYLQRLEADFMIDRVYPRLKRAGLTAFTKHDSLLCSPWDSREATAILKAVFAELGFVAKVRLKTTEHTVGNPLPNKTQLPSAITVPTTPLMLVPRKEHASSELLSEAEWEDLFIFIDNYEKV